MKQKTRISLIVLLFLVSVDFALSNQKSEVVVIPSEVVNITHEAIKTETIKIDIRKAEEIHAIPKGCENLCGDGICQRIVCMALGCPCPETAESCPQDCKKIGLANPASAYCEESGYKLDIRKDAEGNEYGVCVFPDGNECEEWAFYKGDCGQEYKKIEQEKIEEVIKARPTISLPNETSIKILPSEAKPILIEDRPVEFTGIEETPTISVKIRPKIHPGMPAKASQIVCQATLREEIGKCISAGNSTDVCKAEYERIVKEKCFNKTAEEIANLLPAVSVKVDIDKENKETRIEVANTTAVTREILKFKQSSMRIETPKGDVVVQVLPNAATEVAISKEPQKIDIVELRLEEEKPIYRIGGSKDAKLLWIIPVVVPVTTHISGETGEIIKIEKPWWSFLAR
ncbi:MAG: DUF333 domain-containing protein [Candidatus Aenigmatarchaeota archaeon]